MSEEVRNIEVVTRVEGHAKVTFVLDNKGNVEDARFHVLEFKGFEKFMQGRMFHDAPRITTRICGICPVSHHLASVKACEDLLGAKPPETAILLRELMHMGQFIHSHALHFFFLAAPDFILGPDSPPQDRNILGLLKANPELVKDVIRIRKFGQNLIGLIGGKAIHPVTAIPGGMSKGITETERKNTEKELNEIVPLFEDILYICQNQLNQYAEFINDFAVIETNFLGLANNKNELELYDGKVRIMDKECKLLDNINPSEYFKYIGEHTEPWTYLKFPFIRNIGWPKGIYRVGPLARINICDKIGTPKAQKALVDFRRIFERPANQTLAYHHSRLIELLYAMEKTKELLNNPLITSDKINVKLEKHAGEGIGVIEAPRGTLIHHYKANHLGKLTEVNLIVATVNNNAAINLSIKSAAEKLIQNASISKGDLNKIEMAVRAYDPCLTCAAHSTQEIVKSIDFVDKKGKLLNQINY